MALIGNPLNSVAFLTDSFNGNGSTTAFTMSVAPATSSSILVVISGVTQNPTTYSVVGTTLTFSTAPPSGTANISVRYLGIPASGVTTTAYRTLTEFTATASQTTFTPPSYTVGFIAVYQNGVMLGSADYTASNGTTVVLAVGALVGDLISTESFYVSSVLNALPVTGGTISGNLVVTGTETVGTIISPAALTLQTNNGTTAITVDTSQNVGIGTTSPASNVGSKLSVVGGGVYTNSGYGLTVDGSYFTPSGLTAIPNYGLGNPAASQVSLSAFVERMRIDSSGTVLMGQTTNPATGTLVLKVPTGTGNGVNAQITSNTGTSYPFSNYNASSSYVGGISCTSSATAFPTSSDVRLKKNITDAPSAMGKILSAQVVSHDWINDEAHVDYGFVAQDLQDTIPQAVIEGTDKEDGSIDMPWGVDYSKIVPLLVKSIQEQQALITQLQADVAALKGAK